MKTATRSEELSSRAHGNSSTSVSTNITHILVHLLSGPSLNRFEAENLGDHCLPSTIAVLANRHGLVLLRQSEKVPNSFGKPCYVTRYSMPASEHGKTRRVLAHLSRTTRPTIKG